MRNSLGARLFFLMGKPSCRICKPYKVGTGDTGSDAKHQNALSPKFLSPTSSHTMCIVNCKTRIELSNRELQSGGPPATPKSKFLSPTYHLTSQVLFVRHRPRLPGQGMRQTLHSAFSRRPREARPPTALAEPALQPSASPSQGNPSTCRAEQTC
jgi:hypothetical protein